MLVLWVKRLANMVVAPTWCAKCGERLIEQPIGFRELGGRYRCPNRLCELYDLPTLVPGM